MFGRISRSLELVKFSAGVLRTDKELLVFPALSSIAAILVFASFLPFFVSGDGNPMPVGEAVPADQVVYIDGEPIMREGGDETAFLTFAVFYLVQYFVIFFFNSALVGAALIRMRGGDPTVGDGLRIALAKIWPIFGYAMIAATVGLVLRAVAERVGFIAQIVVGLLGVAWTLASYLTVPVLVSRDIGPADAVRESARLLKSTWGENVIANAGISVFFWLVYVAVLVLFVGLAVLTGGPGRGDWVLGWATFGVLVFVVLALIHAALQGIFSAALYHYAAGDDGDADPGAETGIMPPALANAFVPK